MRFVSKRGLQVGGAGGRRTVRLLSTTRTVSGLGAPAESSQAAVDDVSLNTP